MHWRELVVFYFCFGKIYSVSHMKRLFLRIHNPNVCDLCYCLSILDVEKTFTKGFKVGVVLCLCFMK